MGIRSRKTATARYFPTLTEGSNPPLKNMGFLWDKRGISVKANPANPFAVRVYGIKNQKRITRKKIHRFLTVSFRLETRANPLFMRFFGFIAFPFFY